MPGGKGNIRPEDCPRPFDENYNGKTFEKWTEKKVHLLLDKLHNWLLEDIIISDDDGDIISTEDKGNCYYKYWLFKEGLSSDWVAYVSKKFSSVRDRMRNIDEIQEVKLQLLASIGKHKEGMNKFVLNVKHKWMESSKNVIEHKGLNINLKDLIDFKDNKDKDSDEDNSK